MTNLLLTILLLISPAALADKDHDRARDALRRGEILPLAEILPKIERRYRARLLEVELEREDGIIVYELELITRDGRIIELEVDAASGAVIGKEIDRSRRTGS
ncbi:PepSY domain-containing protein [Afifella pfennigii]|uniref:PepSY domain-containing protein n=1 Tax=Afifella pfennigii TaxID=209897 RepID=UPI000479953E|nr:PepSY domain-containing protein [Afifella pfennigii]